jgi:hypothetical protein
LSSHPQIRYCHPNMKTKLFFIVFLLGFNAWATPEFQGAWAGEGTMKLQNSTETNATQITVKITHNENQMSIQDCWIIPSNDSIKRSLCHESQFRVNDTEIFNGEEKVGDITPTKMTIDYSTTKDTIQMLFSLNSDRQMRYYYSQTSTDSETLTRMGDLPEKK